MFSIAIERDLRELDQDRLVLVGEVAVALVESVEEPDRRGRRASVSGAASQPQARRRSLATSDVHESAIPARAASAGPRLRSTRKRGQRGRVAQDGALPRGLVAGRDSDTADAARIRSGSPSRDRDRLVRAEDVAGELGRRTWSIASSESAELIASEACGQPLELRRALARAIRACARDLLGLAEEVDEDGDLRPQHLGHDRREDVVDRAERVAARGVHLVAEGGDEDDRRVLGALALRGSARRSRSRPCPAC